MQIWLLWLALATRDPRHAERLFAAYIAAYPDDPTIALAGPRWFAATVRAEDYLALPDEVDRLLALPAGRTGPLHGWLVWAHHDLLLKFSRDRATVLECTACPDRRVERATHALPFLIRAALEQPSSDDLRTVATELEVVDPARAESWFRAAAAFTTDRGHRWLANAHAASLARARDPRRAAEELVRLSLGACGCQRRDQAEVRFDAATQHYELGDTDLATALFQTYLRDFSDQPDARLARHRLDELALLPHSR